MEAAWKAIVKSLAQTTIGNPGNDKVRMGSLAGQSQREEVRAQVRRLLASSQLIYGSLDSVEIDRRGCGQRRLSFPPPAIERRPLSPAKSPTRSKLSAPSVRSCHTSIPMKSSSLAKKARASSAAPSSPQTPASPAAMSWAPLPGMAVSSSSTTNARRKAPVTAARCRCWSMAAPAAPAAAKKWAASAAYRHYMQRVAVQGSPSMITTLTNTWQPHARQTTEDKHPFRKYFEELQIGDTVITHKRTVTEADITSFANLSWDHFYAHTDHTSLKDTLVRETGRARLFYPQRGCRPLRRSRQRPRHAELRPRRMPFPQACLRRQHHRGQADL